MKKVIVLGISGLLLWSCNNSTEKTNVVEEVETHAAHHHNEGFESIELNNGERWMVNEEMKPYVFKGSSLVDEYIKEGKTDYKTLAQQLKDQNNQLIKSCTMDGKSHDELHKWLHPHLELVSELENEENTARANEIISEIQHSYQEYHQYFN